MYSRETITSMMGLWRGIEEQRGSELAEGSMNAGTPHSPAQDGILCDCPRQAIIFRCQQRESKRAVALMAIIINNFNGTILVPQSTRTFLKSQWLFRD